MFLSKFCLRVEGFVFCVQGSNLVQEAQLVYFMLCKDIENNELCICKKFQALTK